MQFGAELQFGADLLRVAKKVGLISHV